MSKRKYKKKKRPPLKRRSLTEKSRSKWYHIRRTYGLSQEQWLEIYKEQDGRCFLCQRDEAKIKKGKMKYLSVDHCHATGKIRGLLCGNCNHNILPVFERDNRMAQRIWVYLTREKDYGLVPLVANPDA